MSLEDVSNSMADMAVNANETAVNVEDIIVDGENKPLTKSALKKLAKQKLKDAKKEKKAIVPASSSKKEPKKKKQVVSVPIFLNETVKGEKKSMSAEMAIAYYPEAVEAAWQDWWEEKGFFSCSDERIAAADAKERFVMIIPPPNVTGSLHLGHALTVSIQDCLTRWHRMQGHATLWVPGTDHAGIATQSVVEARLMKEEGLSRHDLGREEFLRRVWQWKEQYETRIHKQFRKVGCSVDWKRVYFSMDTNCSKAVVECFNKLWEDKLIYRATRLINWSCKLKTALSDIEVDYIDLEKRTKLPVPGHNPERKYEFGVMTSFGYLIEGSKEQVIVATTRLETMLGDTAVAVHPEDPRYKHLHGKFLLHPFNKRRIPIILDAELVDMEVGTGCVKITPAHDPNDYECGKRHNLEFITVISDEGAINENGGQFAGMMRYDARVEVEKALAAIGQFHGKVDNKMRLGCCSRSGDIIEPLIKPQWFVDCKQMAADAIAAVENGDLKIEPPSHKATWNRWLENIRDWCISRQLWWGHRIPAYFATIEGEEWIDPSSTTANDRWVAGRSEEDARTKAAIKLGVDESKIILRQDEDVLDTWVSAALFPFAVFGWPEKTPDFYPTDFLETGYDILFFWVARMVFMGQKLTGKLPFHTVYLHSMVRDKEGRKMSKSLGNVIDPLEIINGCTLDELYAKLENGNLPAKEIEKAKKGQLKAFPQGIPECGADALRFGLLSYTQQGRDINLDINRLVSDRNFCNKLWNATKFAISNLGEDFRPTEGMASSVLQNEVVHLRDRFILSRLNATIIETNACFTGNNFGDAAMAIRKFWLDDLCGLYLELTKPVIYKNEEGKKTAQEVLYICLEYGLRLLHPMMPYVTEELWQRLPGGHAIESICIAPYPTPIESWANVVVETGMELVKDTIHAGNSVRQEFGLLNNVKPACYFKCATKQSCDILRAHASDFQTLVKAGDVTVLTAGEDPPHGCALHSLNDDVQLYVMLQGLVDFENEIVKIEKKISELQPSINALEAKMGADGYSTKVPVQVQEKNTTKLQRLEGEIVELNNAIHGYRNMQ